MKTLWECIKEGFSIGLSMGIAFSILLLVIIGISALLPAAPVVVAAV